jgi:hypothetical protein
MKVSNTKFFVARTFQLFFNQEVKLKIEIGTLYLAATGFLLHLIAVFLHMWGFIQPPAEVTRLLASPISAVYTPFSFILIYEVYLLVYYLPRSFSIAIAKQFEIISIILIRRIFKDISNLDFQSIELFSAENLNLLYDITGFLTLFFLIFIFRYLLVNRKSHTVTRNIREFIHFKKSLCIVLAPLLVILSVYSLTNWVIEVNQLSLGLIDTVTDFNKIFYNEFFVALVIVDVLILVASFKYTDRYSLLIRNTGFVVSTVLIRISFSTDGLSNIVLLLSGVLFGVIILYLYSLYDKIDRGASTKESYAYL